MSASLVFKSLFLLPQSSLLYFFIILTPSCPRLVEFKSVVLNSLSANLGSGKFYRSFSKSAAVQKTIKYSFICFSAIFDEIFFVRFDSSPFICVVFLLQRGLNHFFLVVHPEAPRSPSIW